MIPLTSSMLERADACPASLVLPSYPHSGPEAARGTRNHAKAENHETLPPTLYALVNELHNWRVEVPYVLDVKSRTARQCEGGARSYGELGEWDIGTTPDVIGVVRDRHWRVRDWKSRKLVTVPRDNLQVISQALAIFTVHGAHSVDAGIGYLSSGEDDPHTFTAFDVPDMWERMRKLVERARAARPDQIREGDHCTYCPALTTCPAKRALATAFGVDIEATIDGLPIEAVGALRAKVESFKKLIDRADGAIKARAAREPIPLGGGKVLRLVESHRTSLNQELVKAYLVERGEDVTQFEKRSEFTMLKEVRAK